MINVAIFVELKAKDCEYSNKFNAKESHDVPVDAALLTCVKLEDLSQLNARQCKSMHTKKDVIDVDFSSVTDGWVHKSLKVVDRVKVEAYGVKHCKFDGEPCNTFS